MYSRVRVPVPGADQIRHWNLGPMLRRCTLRGCIQRFQVDSEMIEVRKVAWSEPLDGVGDLRDARRGLSLV